MTRRACLAILTDALPPDLPDLVAVTEGAYTALLGPRPPRLQLTRRAVLRSAAARLSQLEALMGKGTLLPALPDSTLTEAEARLALRANTAILDRVADLLRGRVQYQLRIGWDAEAALDRFARGPIGPASCAEQLAARFQLWVEERMTGIAPETLALPVAEDLVVNRALLVPAGAGPMLDHALDAIDDLWSDGLRISLVGPTPGMSFASLAIRPLGPDVVAEAVSRLGITPGADANEIRSARRRRLLADGAEAGPQITRAADVAGLAAAAGWPAGSLPEIHVWSEGRAASDRLRGAA
ncbi:hypothetical protein HKCCE3408_06205 [Rhodobacterales bacterium HKCCE3408]|nr:hypothetical protein [Rhodobacterales bacterium HKCCE3408]